MADEEIPGLSLSDSARPAEYSAGWLFRLILFYMRELVKSITFREFFFHQDRGPNLVFSSADRSVAMRR